MLFLRKRAERMAVEAKAEFDRQVDAVRIGTVLAHNKKALEGWMRARAARATTPPQSVEGYKATLARLGSLTSRGKPLGLLN